LLTGEQSAGSNVQARHITGGSQGFVPRLAVVDYVLSLSGAIEPFQVAPNADSGRESNELSVLRSILSIQLT
jgi:hypothetical protein